MISAPSLKGSTYRSPDEADGSADVDNGESRSLLLLRLSAGITDPGEDDGVDGIRANGKDTHGKVPRSSVERSAAEDETKNGDDLGHGDMPGALVKVTRRPRPENRDDAGDQVRGAGQDQCNSGIKAERLNDTGELSIVSISCSYGI